MEEKIAALVSEVTQLRQIVERHENRIIALEKKLNPQTAEEMSAASMDLLLGELHEAILDTDELDVDALLPEIYGDD